MALSDVQIYEFGDWRLDPAEHLLLRNGTPVSLAPKVFDTLLLLVENAGRLVPKDEFMQRVWPETFVEDVALAQNISLLRKALGDAVPIETVPKRGYRLSGPVRVIAAPSVVNDTTVTGAAIRNSDSYEQALEIEKVPSISGSRRAIVLTVGVVLIVGLATAYFYVHRRNASSAATVPIRSVAVLPLQNLSGNPEEEYFAEGLTDELITDLAKLGAVRVISYTSVTRYKGARKSLREIARELSVDAVVEGTVQNSSGRIHMNAQLVQVQPEKHLWAESYDRPAGDVVTLEEDLAHEIAGAIRVRLTPQQEARLAHGHKVSPEAYRLYLKGRYAWNRRTEQGLRSAIGFFQQAIAEDPNYALAYSGLADSYNLLHFYGGLPPEELIPKTRAAATKAVELDDSLAEAHTSLAYLTHRYDWDWPKAEREYKRALDLNPNYATAHHWYAEYLMVRGRFAEAQEQIRQAKELDPLSLEINTDEGLPFYFTHQYGRAIEEYRQAAEMDPSFAPAHFALRDTFELKGMYGEAIQEFRRGLALSGGREEVVGPLAHAFERLGKRGYWRERLNLALRGPEDLRATPTQVANIYAAMGDKPQALAWLEKAYNSRDDELVWLAVEPWHDGLRSEPRFTDLVQRVGLAP